MYVYISACINVYVQFVCLVQLACYVTCRREKHDIPLLVQTCVDEVERRGMDETGIYRVAGVISDVEGLRKAFDSGNSPNCFTV